MHFIEWANADGPALASQLWDITAAAAAALCAHF